MGTGSRVLQPTFWSLSSHSNGTLPCLLLATHPSWTIDPSSFGLTSNSRCRRRRRRAPRRRPRSPRPRRRRPRRRRPRRPRRRSEPAHDPSSRGFGPTGVSRRHHLTTHVTHRPPSLLPHFVSLRSRRSSSLPPLPHHHLSRRERSALRRRTRNRASATHETRVPESVAFCSKKRLGLGSVESCASHLGTVVLLCSPAFLHNPSAFPFFPSLQKYNLSAAGSTSSPKPCNCRARNPRSEAHTFFSAVSASSRAILSELRLQWRLSMPPALLVQGCPPLCPQRRWH